MARQQLRTAWLRRITGARGAGERVLSQVLVAVVNIFLLAMRDPNQVASGAHGEEVVHDSHSPTFCSLLVANCCSALRIRYVCQLSGLRRSHIAYSGSHSP